MVETDNRQLLDWDALEIGESLPSFEYVLTQEMVDLYRQGVGDPRGSLPDGVPQSGRRRVPHGVPR